MLFQFHRTPTSRYEGFSLCGQQEPVLEKLGPDQSQSDPEGRTLLVSSPRARTALFASGISWTGRLEEVTRL